MAMQQAVDTCIMALQCDSLCFWIIMNIQVFTVFTIGGVEEPSEVTGYWANKFLLGLVGS